MHAHSDMDMPRRPAMFRLKGALSAAAAMIICYVVTYIAIRYFYSVPFDAYAISRMGEWVPEEKRKTIIHKLNYKHSNYVVIAPPTGVSNILQVTFYPLYIIDRELTGCVWKIDGYMPESQGFPDWFTDP